MGKLQGDMGMLRGAGVRAYVDDCMSERHAPTMADIFASNLFLVASFVMLNVASSEVSRVYAQWTIYLLPLTSYPPRPSESCY